MLLADLGPTALLNPDWVGRWMRLGTNACAATPGADPAPVATDVEVVARFFELVAVTDGFIEACRMLGVQDISTLTEELNAGLAALVKHFTDYDAEAVFKEHAQLVEELRRKSPGTPARDATDLFDKLTYATRVLVATCPIDNFRTRARTPERYNWFDRLEKARRVMRGFLRRNDPEEAKVREGVARAFKEGHATLSEAADYLGMRPGDAVAFMEKLDSCRTPDVVRLDDEARRALLKRIRKSRIEGARSKERAKDIARRSALSSMRLEGVDARPWLPPKHS